MSCAHLECSAAACDGSTFEAESSLPYEGFNASGASRLIELSGRGGWIATGKPAGVPVVTRPHGGRFFVWRFASRKRPLRLPLRRPGLAARFRMSRLPERLELLSIRASDGVVAVSNYMADCVRSMYSPRTQPRIETIPNSIDVDLFIPAKHDKVVKGRLLYVNRIHEPKGVCTLFAALPEVFAKNADAHLVVLGSARDRFLDGKPYDEGLLARLSPADRSRVTFLGYIPHAETVGGVLI